MRAARQRVAPYLRRTPVGVMEHPRLRLPVLLKCEQMQHTGSFKVRGAFNRVLTVLEEAGVEPGQPSDLAFVAASGGNAGMAVAHACAVLGQRAVVFVPETAPVVKVDRLRALGAQVEQRGSEYADAYEGAQAYLAERPGIFCHAYDQLEIVAGQGTIALELMEQVNGELDTLLVATGGGGLVAGCAAALADSPVRVVAVEPETAQALHAALEAGAPVDVQVGGLAADSLGARRAGEIAFATARATGLESVLVPEDSLALARRDLWERARVVVEHGTAAAWAALDGAVRLDRDERVGVLLCGGNTDPATL